MLIKKNKFALSPPTHQATRLFCLFLVFPLLARSQNQGTNSFIGAGVNSGNRIPAGITNSGIVAGAMNTNGGGYSFIGGGVGNSIGSGGGGYLYSVIGGGLGNKCPTGFSFVGGGVSNVVEGIGYYSGTIGDGAQNYVWTGFYGAATISGGRLNSATNGYATVGGGYLNRAGGMGDFVGGGQLNSANSILGVVVGGYQNTNKGY